jgi:hypothetical protein
MNEIEILKRLTALKEWQYLNRKQIEVDNFMQGYNAAVLQEIRFLEEKLKK